MQIGKREKNSPPEPLPPMFSRLYTCQECEVDIRRFVRAEVGVICAECETLATRVSEVTSPASAGTCSPSDFGSPTHPLTQSMSREKDSGEKDGADKKNRFLATPTAQTPNRQLQTPTRHTPTKWTPTRPPAVPTPTRQLQQQSVELQARVKHLEAVNKHMVKSVDDVAANSVDMEEQMRHT